MDNLPDILVTKIAEYLTPRDLMACSAVCKLWREIFNINDIWKEHLLSPGKIYNIQYLFKDMILCPPTIQTLQPLCVARERYIRDQCLRFHCRAGLFTIEGFTPKIKQEILQMINVLDNFGNYWLFLLTLKSVEVWNITNKPFFQSRTLKMLPDLRETMHVVDMKVFLVLFNFVHVFSFEHPKYELVFRSRFCIDRETLSDTTLDSGLCSVDFKHIVSGNMLIGYPGIITKLTVSDAYLHVWNLETLVKLRCTKILQENISQCIFDEDQRVSKIKCDLHKGHTEFIVLVFEEGTEDRLFSIITVFNMERLAFYPFAKRCVRMTILSSAVLDGHVLIFGFAHSSGFCVTLVDSKARDIVCKNLSRLGVDGNSHFFFNYPEVSIKTSDELLSVEFKDGRLKICPVIVDSFKFEQLSFANLFMFSKDNAGTIKMWDRELRCPITDLTYSNEGIDASQPISLKELHFPPKIIVTNNCSTKVIVLSFW